MWAGATDCDDDADDDGVAEDNNNSGATTPSLPDKYAHRVDSQQPRQLRLATPNDHRIADPRRRDATSAEGLNHDASLGANFLRMLNR